MRLPNQHKKSFYPTQIALLNGKDGSDKNNASFDEVQRKDNRFKNEALVQKSNLNRTFDSNDDPKKRSAEFGLITSTAKRKQMLNGSFEKQNEDLNYLRKDSTRTNKRQSQDSSTTTSNNLFRAQNSMISKDDKEHSREYNGKASVFASTANPESSSRKSSFRADGSKMPVISMRNDVHDPLGAEEKSGGGSKSPREAKSTQYRSEARNQRLFPDITPYKNVAEQQKDP